MTLRKPNYASPENVIAHRGGQNSGRQKMTRLIIIFLLFTTFAHGQTNALLSSRQKYTPDTKTILFRFDSLFIAKDSTLEFKTIGEASKLSNKYILYSKLVLVANEDELLSILNDKTEIPTMRGYAYMAYALKCDKDKRKEKPLKYNFKVHTLNGCLGFTMSFEMFKKYCRERHGYDPNPKKYFPDPEEKKAIKEENKIRKEQGENERKE